METYQIWEETDPDGCGGITLSTKESCENLKERGLLGDKPVMVLEFQAASWTEACQREHDHYGWEPYIPMEGHEDARTD